MKQLKGRSSSLQRGTRAGSDKRGHNERTPRRLSDGQERPAWDATSSNLERFKLTSEEQERRRAARVSKNRPLASSDGKRTFVEAWAKQLTESMLQEDTDLEKDQPPGDSVSRLQPGINYSNVVKLLRKNPSAPSAAAVTPVAARIMFGDETLPGSSLQSRGVAAATGARADVGVTDNHSPNARGDIASHLTPRTSSAEANSVANTVRLEPSFSAAQGCGHSHGGGLDADASGRRTQHKPAFQRNTRNESSSVANGTVAAGPLHRGDDRITPTSLRPRFNSAEATTIIGYGAGTEACGDEDPQDRSLHTGNCASASADSGATGVWEADLVTAAFEAALLGHKSVASSVDTGGGGCGLAWATNQAAASPLDAAASDVERRLQAVEAALGISGSRDPTGGSGGLVEEDVAELHRELRLVQNDNVKLRQELGAFTTHASVIMSQLQAQVQQLLRAAHGDGFGGCSDAASSTAAASSSAVGTHKLSSKLQMAPSRPAPTTAASIPTTVDAAKNIATATGHMPYDDARGNRHVLQPHISMPPQQQPMARLNIYADLDSSSFRPLATAGPVHNLSRHKVDDVPMTPFEAGAALQATASSPQIDIVSVPRATYSVMYDAEDSEVMLPSFAAFRRSAITATFTAARPNGTAAGGLPPSSSYPATNNAIAMTSEASFTSTVSASKSLHPLPAAGPHFNTAIVQPRPLPSQYQPRSLGNGKAWSGTNPNLTVPTVATSVGLAAAAATGTNVASGAYMTSLAMATTSAVASSSDTIAAALARSHPGMPKPLVFSIDPEFRSSRATGLPAENSMSLSAHAAATVAMRTKGSIAAPGGARAY